MTKRIFISILIFFISVGVYSQKKNSTEEYIEKYYKIAIKEMRTYRIPASITLAQGVLESASGNSALARKAKNHFGIKCHKNWKGKRYYMDDDEKDECFRVYKTPEKSFKDHSDFLRTRGRYEFLFVDYEITDYKKWAHGLKKAGYATNPKYPKLLISIIEKHHLYKYDRQDFVPEITVQEDVLVLEEIKDEDFILEQTDEYIKALMGKNVYYSDSENGIFIFNRIKTIKAKGETPIEIAIDYNIDHERLLKYNEMTPNDYFKIGQNVFLQPKRINGSQKDYVAKPGDSMWEISQMFGIKISSIHKKNLTSAGEHPLPGEFVFLRKNRKEKIKTISFAEVFKTKKALKDDKPKKIIQKTVVKDEYKSDKSVTINIFNSPVNNPKKEIKLTETNLDVYPKEKYIDKNEQMEKLINEIPIENKETINSNKFTYHTVKQGETLYFLSKKYYTTVTEIKRLNNLIDNSIDIGQELIISQKE